MKKLLLAAAVLGLSAGYASAADLGARPYAKAPAPVYSWTGFYIGGQVGAASLSPTFKDDFFLGRVNADRTYSFAGGAYGGYNWQFNSLVVGLDAQWSWYGDGSVTSFPAGTNNPDVFFTTKVRDAGSVKARIGLAFQDTLVYVAAGPAWANSTLSVGAGQLFNVSQSAYRSGIAVATGVEHMFTPNWVLRGQVQYSDFSTQRATASFLGGGGDPLAASFGQQTSIVEATVGLAYKF